MTEIEVKIPAKPQTAYKIYIGTDLLQSLWKQLQQRFPDNPRFIVTDTNLVAAGHLKSLIGSNDVLTFIIDPPGEISKNIQTVAAIIEKMEEAFLGRDSMVVALGGGTVGDIAGFAAAIFKRGVKVVHIPTTPVSQADSSVGGKTGVDSAQSKNAFGAFWQPAAVYIDVATLKTLDDLQYRAGLVESVKHALIADADYFDFLEANIDRILNRDMAVLEKIAVSNCRIKGAVVEEDPTEKNKRRILNYGHTIGHAVESASNYKLLHGEAVAIGIIAAAKIEEEMGLLKDERLTRIKNILAKLDMPATIPGDIQKGEVIDIMKHDKKAVTGRPKFVLLEKIGKTLCKNGEYAHDIPKEVLEKTLKELY
jgi:3-dehydroquinate synthase